MSCMLDASAILAFLQGEPGADLVEERLLAAARCAAVNWSEVAQKVRAAGRDWDLARALLLSYAVVVEPVTQEDGEWAAARWRPGEGLALADRLCLALGERLSMVTVTADIAWGSSESVVQIR